MQKTKLGIAVGLLGAAIYFIGLFGGFLAAVVLAGYVLLSEENEWLRKSAVKAVALMVFFSLLSAIVNLIPNTIGVIDDLLNIFGGYVSIDILSAIINFILSVIALVEKIVFLLLGLIAIKQVTITIPVIDKLINKYMD